MIREQVLKRELGKTNAFRWRSHEISAYRKRAALDLNQLEVFDTPKERALNCGVAMFSMGLLLLGGPRLAGLAGFSYMLTGVVMAVNGTVMGARRRKLEKGFESGAEAESVQS